MDREILYQLSYDDNQLSSLKDRANDKCIKFSSQRLPSDCSPKYADIGIEYLPSNGTCNFHVQKGVKYQGPNLELKEWFKSGTKSFDTYLELKNWIASNLQSSFQQRDSNTQSNMLNVNGAVTDFDQIYELIEETEKSSFLDETEILQGLKEEVKGQDLALIPLASNIVRHFARVSPSRPSVLFFIGPSGVGKTKTAQTLAKVLNDRLDDKSKCKFLRLDMNEYQEEHRVSQLLGAPQGYIGYGENSQLIDVLSTYPRSVILFDEIEKAHKKIVQALMNAMDAGRISSASKVNGVNEVDCKSSVFLFTSNLKSDKIISEIDSLDASNDYAIVDQVCRKHLKSSGIPNEIVGRIGEFLLFKSLNRATQAEIVANIIREVATEYGLKVKYVEPTVVVRLMKNTHSKNYGARMAIYEVDRQLSDVFIDAASKNNDSKEIRIVGPPYDWELASRNN